MLADVPLRVRLLSVGILVYAAVLGLWPAWITPGLYFLFVMLLLPLFAVLCIVVLVTLIGLLRAWHKQRIGRRAWLGPLSLLLAMALVVPTLRGTEYVRDLVLFSVVQDWTTERLEQSPQPGAMDGPLGIEVIVEAGPPVRMAFVTDPGFLDNWSGIVFDPTGVVMQADGWDAKGKFRAPPPVTQLFGGDIVACNHLSGDYYQCAFT